jgi:broad specificity phosphatase PhoE
MSSVQTIYMIRHAESEENRRLASLQTVWSDLTNFRLPKSSDIWSSLRLVRVFDQVDSHVSDFGKQQIAHMAKLLRESDFVKSHQIQLVAHSPLLRAKETSQGMLGYALENKDIITSPRVLELDLLIEKTPAEWIPGNLGSLMARLRSLEEWIIEQPEDNIALVGHSQFFKALLELDYKFPNCSVYSAQFDRDTKQWSAVTEIHACELMDENPPTVEESNGGQEEHIANGDASKPVVEDSKQ